MKKQLLFIFTLGTLSLFSQSVGTTFNDQGFNFRITALSPNEVAITGGGSGSSITIPETVTFNMESYTVVAIGDRAFEFIPFSNPALVNVVFPNSIRTIGKEAFFENNLSGTLALPTNLEIIGEAAFRSNNLSGTLTLPEGLTTIQRDAFFNNASLSEVIFPESLLTISEDAFQFIPLTTITLRSNISIDRGTFGGNALTSIISEIISPSSFPINVNDITRSNIDLTIPAGTSQAYIDAGWTGFKSVTEASDPTLSLSDNTLQESAIKWSLSYTQLVVENSKSNLIALELYDLSGALVFGTTKNVVDTADFSKGVYILRMTFTEGTVVRKIIL